MLSFVLCGKGGSQLEVFELYMLPLIAFWSFNPGSASFLCPLFPYHAQCGWSSWTGEQDPVDPRTYPPPPGLPCSWAGTSQGQAQQDRVSTPLRPLLHGAFQDCPKRPCVLRALCNAKLFLILTSSCNVFPPPNQPPRPDLSSLRAGTLLLRCVAFPRSGVVPGTGPQGGRCLVKTVRKLKRGAGGWFTRADLTIPGTMSSLLSPLSDCPN